MQIPNNIQPSLFMLVTGSAYYGPVNHLTKLQRNLKNISFTTLQYFVRTLAHMAGSYQSQHLFAARCFSADFAIPVIFYPVIKTLWKCLCLLLNLRAENNFANMLKIAQKTGNLFSRHWDLDFSVLVSVLSMRLRFFSIGLCIIIETQTFSVWVSSLRLSLFSLGLIIETQTFSVSDSMI